MSTQDDFTTLKQVWEQTTDEATSLMKSVTQKVRKIKKRFAAADKFEAKHDMVSSPAKVELSALVKDFQTLMSQLHGILDADATTKGQLATRDHNYVLDMERTSLDSVKTTGIGTRRPADALLEDEKEKMELHDALGDNLADLPRPLYLSEGTMVLQQVITAYQTEATACVKLAFQELQEQVKHAAFDTFQRSSKKTTANDLEEKLNHIMESACGNIELSRVLAITMLTASWNSACSITESRAAKPHDGSEADESLSTIKKELERILKSAGDSKAMFGVEQNQIDTVVTGWNSSAAAGRLKSFPITSRPVKWLLELLIRVHIPATQTRVPIWKPKYFTSRIEDCKTLQSLIEVVNTTCTKIAQHEVDSTESKQTCFQLWQVQVSERAISGEDLLQAVRSSAAWSNWYHRTMNSAGAGILRVNLAFNVETVGPAVAAPPAKRIKTSTGGYPVMEEDATVKLFRADKWIEES